MDTQKSQTLDRCLMRFVASVARAEGLKYCSSVQENARFMRKLVLQCLLYVQCVVHSAHPRLPPSPFSASSRKHPAPRGTSYVGVSIGHGTGGTEFAHLMKSASSELEALIGGVLLAVAAFLGPEVAA